MARFTDAELERLKTEMSLVRLVEAAGVGLKKHGKDWLGRCPFHDDKTPSLVVSPDTNLWHCLGACQTGGSTIDWVMKTQGISFRHACELLQQDAGLAVISDAAQVKRSSTKKLSSPLAAASPSAGDQTLLRQVIDFYHDTLKQSPEALAYLDARGLNHPELIERFQLGYANRSLGYRLPDKTRKAGAEARGALQALGILRDSGHEHFNGSLVVPVINDHGHISDVYGRKIRDDLRPGTAYHLYLPGPHAGVWNEVGLAAAGGEIILCEALIDAMTFWVHGFRNVTASYGVSGFTTAHLATFKTHGVVRVLIAYDRDEAGNAAADKLADMLTAEGIACFRVLFPKGMDANDYALKMSPADKALGLALRRAEWMGNGQAPALTTARAESVPTVVAPPTANPAAKEKNEPAPITPLAAKITTAPEPATTAADIPESRHASPLPSVPAPVDTQTTEHETTITLGDRRYRVRGLNKNAGPEQLKINLLVSRNDALHIDSLDLYSAKARASYIKQASIELGLSEEAIKADLGRVLLKLEELQEQQRQQAETPLEQIPQLSTADETAALELLKSPELLARILADFAACGVVGEATNTLVGYLAGVSRKLDKPLAVIIQSSSAAGKSSLMDAVLAMMPTEERVQYSAMTGQSLFYMGETSLKHKILAIAEEEGAHSASYALKLLQSDGAVTIASTGKDATTGNLMTQEYRVEGPVMLFLTTTAIDIDEELLNRCLVLTVNESREQTAAIHARQRHGQTLAGLLADEARKALVNLHQNAQRLLKPLLVAKAKPAAAS